MAAGGYAGTGGLQVTLGGVNANLINGHVGRLDLHPQPGGCRERACQLSLALQTGPGNGYYEFDEFSRVLVKVDGTQYGRGAKNYVDHIGGDGSSSQGNSSTYVVTTDWQQVEIYLGNLPAGSHSLVLGGFNNKKDASDETTTLVIDDVLLTSGNAAPVTSDAETVVGPGGHQPVPGLQPGHCPVR